VFRVEEVVFAKPGFLWMNVEGVGDNSPFLTMIALNPSFGHFDHEGGGSIYAPFCLASITFENAFFSPP